MTEYRLVHVRRNRHSVLARVPKFSDTAIVVVNASDTRVTRNGDTRVTRNGDTRIAHNTTTMYPRERTVRKRSFSIRGKVNNG